MLIKHYIIESLDKEEIALVVVKSNVELLPQQIILAWALHVRNQQALDNYHCYEIEPLTMLIPEAP